MIPGIQELMYIVIIIILLSGTGLWPVVVRALRELRGERVETPSSSSPAPGSTNVDLPYHMLGLSPSATWAEVEKAYRQKAKLHHPDHGGDEDTMRALNEAYQLIKRLRQR